MGITNNVNSMILLLLLLFSNSGGVYAFSVQQQCPSSSTSTTDEQQQQRPRQSCRLRLRTTTSRRTRTRSASSSLVSLDSFVKRNDGDVTFMMDTNRPPQPIVIPQAQLQRQQQQIVEETLSTGLGFKDDVSEVPKSYDLPVIMDENKSSDEEQEKPSSSSGEGAGSQPQAQEVQAQEAQEIAQAQPKEQQKQAAATTTTTAKEVKPPASRGGGDYESDLPMMERSIGSLVRKEVFGEPDVVPGGAKHKDTQTATSPGARSNEPSIWDMLSSRIQQVSGDSLRTWLSTSPAIDRVQVSLKSEGGPLNATLSVWHGPNNTPQRVSVYSEDGITHPFDAAIATPYGNNALAIRNYGHVEFPLLACVLEEQSEQDSIMDTLPNGGMIWNGGANGPQPTQGGAGGAGGGFSNVEDDINTVGVIGRKIHGGAIRTYPISDAVTSVQVMLITSQHHGERPLHARVELTHGPNNSRQIIDVYTENGSKRPFITTLATPGKGYVVRVLNTAPNSAFPIIASVVANEEIQHINHQQQHHIQPSDQQQLNYHGEQQQHQDQHTPPRWITPAAEEHSAVTAAAAAAPVYPSSHYLQQQQQQHDAYYQQYLQYHPAAATRETATSSLAP